MTDAATQEIPLAADFPARTHEEWQGLVAAVLNKSRTPETALTGPAAEESMRSHLLGGLQVDPIYLRPADRHPLGMPGQAPFTRGRAVRDTSMPWDVRALHDDPDPAVTRSAVLADLERGVTSIWLHVGTDGIAPADIAEVLADVRLDLAPVTLSSWDAQEAGATALLAVLDAAPGDTVGGNLGLDPLGAAARAGGSPDLAPLAAAVRTCSDRPGLRAITVDTRPYAEAGANDVDEVAVALATGVAYLRHLDAEGVAPADAFGQIEFRVSATQDQFVTAAKLRALRTCWARVGEASGVPVDDRGAQTHAVTALRMVTRDDPFTNVLRNTLASFGASLGGADAITVLPHDTVWGLPDAFSRRLARNTQILLADESNVGRVTDPAGGSWYVESLTADLAEAAWAVFQGIEGHGGMVAALAAGIPQARLAATRAERDTALATRRLPITGVSMFPATAETPLERRPRAILPTAAGALPVHRDSTAYEALRDRATALGSPAVTVRTLGTQRDFGARQMFVTNLLAAGGIGATEEASPTVVLASSKTGYAAHAREAIEAARAAGATRVLLAGRSRELGEDAGLVDGEVFDGMDVVAFLADVLDQLGAPTEGAPA